MVEIPSTRKFDRWSNQQRQQHWKARVTFPAWSIRMTKQVSFSTFNSIIKRRGMGGNAYANIPSQDRDIASTAQAKGSWNGDTKVGSWLFSLVANRSMCGTSQKRKIWDRVPQWRVHSVWMIYPFLESESVSTFSLPRTNLAVTLHTMLAAWLPWTTRFKTWPHPHPSFVQISHQGCVVCWQQHLAVGNYLTKGLQS